MVLDFLDFLAPPNDSETSGLKKGHWHTLPHTVCCPRCICFPFIVWQLLLQAIATVRINMLPTVASGVHSSFPLVFWTSHCKCSHQRASCCSQLCSFKFPARTFVPSVCSMAVAPEDMTFDDMEAACAGLFCRHLQSLHLLTLDRWFQ